MAYQCWVLECSECHARALAWRGERASAPLFTDGSPGSPRVVCCAACERVLLVEAAAVVACSAAERTEWSDLPLARLPRDDEIERALTRSHDVATERALRIALLELQTRPLKLVVSEVAVSVGILGVVTFAFWFLAVRLFMLQASLFAGWELCLAVLFTGICWWAVDLSGRELRALWRARRASLVRAVDATVLSTYREPATAGRTYRANLERLSELLGTSNESILLRAEVARLLGRHAEAIELSSREPRSAWSETIRREAQRGRQWVVRVRGAARR